MSVGLTTVLVGDESLTTECGEILRQGGHPVLALVTRSTAAAHWARERAIPVIAPGPGLAGRLASVGAFDWLLSVANLSVLADEVLALPARGAINFHDGPLPRYAGLYCTSWALLHHEPRHGVTWHLIEGGIDEGRVLMQQLFDVAPDETALTLNAKCWSAGIESFRALAAQLASDSVAPRAQDLGERTYFARDQRPLGLATIDWDAPVQDVAALVRALDFGAYANPLCVAKVGLDGAVALVGGARAVDAELAPPGTVLAVEGEAARVACADGAVELTGWRDADGAPRTPIELGLRAGLRLPALAPDRVARLDAIGARVVRYERAWARDLALPPMAPTSAAPTGRRREHEDLVRRDGATPEALCAAMCAALARVTGLERASVGLVHPELAALRELDGWIAPVVPLAIELEGDPSIEVARAGLAGRVARARERLSYPRDLVARTPGLRAFAPAIGIRMVDAPAALAPLGTHATFEVAPGRVRALVDEAVGEDTMRRVGLALAAFLDGGAGSVHALPILDDAEREELLSDLARTATPLEPAPTLVAAFEAQVDRTPARTALVFEGASLTYAELDARANQLAHRLGERGLARGDLVGLHVERSLDLVVAMLGIQKAGAAYVPMDPDYPRERVLHMIEDSKAKLVVTDGGRPTPCERVEALSMDRLEGAPATRLDAGLDGADLAYVIYTSGSTGRPKGVMVEHRNVLNFFAGMDARIAHDPPGTWLAVTSPSFDISVLELGWTLARGFTVLLHRDRRAEHGGVAPELAARPMDFGLCYWGNEDGVGRGKYRLLLEGAKWADANGLHSVWTPERHFHAFGGPYANPSVSGAAVAAITKNVAVRSCSCVLPLHHPVRVAEEWAMVDNLCEGRVGLGIAAGWQPDDFVLRPENAPPLAKDAMLRDIEVLRRLWRGEAVEFPKADGTRHAVVSQPRPVSAEVPIWLTIALNPASWIQAAEIGANVLTHLLGQSIEELAQKIQLYRARRAELGMDPGKVTLMLHTFVDPDREVAREVTREPLKRYLASAASLIKQYVWMFPALKRPHGADAAENIDLDGIAPEDMDAVLEHAFSRYFDESGLLGSVEDGVARVEGLKAIGVDEIGCLIDYGVDASRVLESLPHLGEVVRRTARPAASRALTFAELVRDHGATHLQCTPSMARMLLLDDASRDALGALAHVMVGGEALPPAVARGVREASPATLTNMYGPTETTIWSSTDRIEDPEAITIGRPIANTALYVLDARRRLVAPGAIGELWIGGQGVARGYLDRPELTAERFVADPFAGGEARMYRTGDLVRRRADGRLEFVGRADHQVKYRGYRIELGEIEAVLEEQPGVAAAVLVARDPGDGSEPRLVGYVAGSAALEPGALKRALGARLPAYMIPAQVVLLPRLPLTPNGKVDRAALPDPADVAAAETSAPAESPLEERIAGVWQRVLGVPRVGRSDNFFDLGGHSLLAVRLHRELGAVIDAPLSMTDIFRFPTVRALAAHLEGGPEARAALGEVAARAAARRRARPGSGTKRVLGRRE